MKNFWKIFYKNIYIYRFILNRQEGESKNNKNRLCNCAKGKKCPLDGRCLEESIVYQADIAHKNKNLVVEKLYIGLTAQTFKQRYSGHLHDFKYPKIGGTTLSSYIEQLKIKNIEYTIRWTRSLIWNVNFSSCTSGFLYMAEKLSLRRVQWYLSRKNLSRRFFATTRIFRVWFRR